MEEHHWFKTKTTALKELWKKRLISFEQLYSMYQQAQEEVNHKWEDREIEEILTT